MKELLEYQHQWNLHFPARGHTLIFISSLVTMIKLPAAFLFLLFACFFSIGSLNAQSSYSDELIAERVLKDGELKKKKTSPLQKEDRKAFSHLHYFDADESWNLEASYIRLDGKDTIDFATSSGRVKKFVRYAKLTFSKGGADHDLFAYKRVYPAGYKPNHAPYLFLPFTDHTTGEECYGGGRYMDIGVPTEDQTTVMLDFNRCYNPYCAYGGGFSCPIPPKDNALEIRVEAGEKDYGHH